ncbi:MAG: bifunctional 5,10-methylenetetrahydrofolate dehydrogenase/5,10-methenyltetrahydrofolate cyclohydrolase, partial [Planctomycetota bacterium]
KGIDAGVVQQHIDYTKDVEGITPASLGLLLQDRPHLVPCTALAAVELLQRAVGKLEGLDVTVLGRSVTVGKPVAMLLLSKSAKRSCTVTVCHTATKDLISKVKQADALVAAAGVAEFVKGSWIKPGAVVIDVGINRIPVLDANGQPILNEKGKKKMKTVGDVEFETAKETTSKITPVPGGVGSMTTAILMKNTLLAAKLLRGK